MLRTPPGNRTARFTALAALSFACLLACSEASAPRSADGGPSGAGSSGSSGGVGAGGSAQAGGTFLGGGTSSAGTGGGRTYYVTPSGSASNDGTSFASAMDFSTARSRVVAGDTILLQAGTYPIAYVADTKNTITFSQTGEANDPIRVVVEGGRAKFDFSFPEQAWVQDGYGFFVTGSHWYFNGIDVTRAGYQGVYVTGEHNTFENCAFYENRNTGLEINKGGAYTTVINSDAYRNYDPKKFGSMADGFGPKETQGPGNRFIGCRAWENSDDGFDAYESPERVTFENCWAFRNGIDVWNYGGFDGNGNGFKVGGNAAQANHQLTGCLAFDNPVKGFDQNNNTGGITIYNSTGFQNGTNFALGGTLNAGQQHVLKNNVSLGSTDTIANASQQNNSWNSGFSASGSDFLSVDIALGSRTRPNDGSLPQNDFLRLAPGSTLIDRGVDVGLPFLGAAPDLGAFEAR